MNFNGKVVLVTGASSGIGAGIALKFASSGAMVAMVGRNEKKLRHISSQLEKVDNKPLLIVADVSKDDDARRVISETVEHFGRLDVLVNNAGKAGIAGVAEDDFMEVYDGVMAINLRAPLHLTHLATPHLIKSKGNVINISSMAALGIIHDKNSAYAASKAALDHSSKSIALELAPKGIRVNNINPGYVKTNLIENIFQNKDYEEAAWKSLAHLSPLDRLCEVSEIAELTLFLASDKAKGITGSSYLIDSGALLLSAKCNIIKVNK